MFCLPAHLLRQSPLGDAYHLICASRGCSGAELKSNAAETPSISRQVWRGNLHWLLCKVWGNPLDAFSCITQQSNKWSDWLCALMSHVESIVNIVTSEVTLRAFMHFMEKCNKWNYLLRAFVIVNTHLNFCEVSRKNVMKCCNLFPRSRRTRHSASQAASLALSL